MTYRWGYWGASVTCGVFCAPWITAQLWLLYILFFIVILIIILSKKRAVFVFLFFILGLIAVEQYPEPSYPKEGSVVGKVVLKSGRSLLLESQFGRGYFWFPDEVPEKHSWVVLRYGEGRAELQVPGEPRAWLQRRRARAEKKRVYRWEPLSKQRPKELPLVFKKQKHGGLLWGFATGERFAIAQESKELMRATGTAHLLAISGMHIGLIAGIAALVAKAIGVQLARLGLSHWVPYLICSSASLAAYGYGAKVGWPASAQRAFWMVLIAALGRSFGRKVEVWNLLGIAAMVILLEEPAQLNTLGFQLSFSAVIGMVLISRRFTRLLPPDTPQVLQWVVSAFGISVGASLGTLPWSALYFQSFSWIAPLANLIALPTIGSVAVPLSILASSLPEAYAHPFLWGANWSVECGLTLLKPLALEPLHPAVSPLGSALLFGLIWLRKRPLLMLMGYGLVLAPLNRQHPELRISFLDAGQGDAALIRWPNGQNWLIDAGPSSSSLLRYLRRERIDSLDWVILSHPHLDHMGGLKALQGEIEVSKVLTVRAPEKEETAYQELWEVWKEEKTQIYFPEASFPNELIVHHPLKWSAYGADRVNEESLVVELVYGEHRFLFTGDIEEDAEAMLAPLLDKVDFVKVPHHGSRSSSSLALVNALQPRLALISCGVNNRFGHPHDSSIEAWQASHILRTDQLGTIEIFSDGTLLNGRSWRAETGWSWIKWSQEPD